uniref:Uncharacterized protein n=1 Tax=Arundo donax TaxID=35708 RepID=A0A0A9A7B8_ARUDO
MALTLAVAALGSSSPIRLVASWAITPPSLSKISASSRWAIRHPSVS